MPGSSRPKFWTWWLYCHLMTYKWLHMSKRTRTLHKHFQPPLSASYQPDATDTTCLTTPPARRTKHLSRQPLVPILQKPFLDFILWCFQMEKRGRSRCFSFFGEKLVPVFKKMPVPQTHSIHPASTLAYKLHMESQPTEQEKSTTTWHCNWIHKTHFKSYKRALLIGHCRG